MEYKDIDYSNEELTLIVAQKLEKESLERYHKILDAMTYGTPEEDYKEVHS